MAKEKSPAYQRYPNDYLTDENVVRMTLEQEGAYNRLMDHCWKEGSIPADIPGLAAFCKNVTTAKMRAIWQAVGMCFEPHPTLPGRLVHPRLEKEREKQAEWKAKSSTGGKRGARARWGNDNQTITTPITKPLPNDDIASASASSFAFNATTTSARTAEVETEDWISHTMRLANKGMIDAGIDGQPILASHRSRQSVHDWLQDGIPRDVIESVVYATAKEAGKQISSMKYFSNAVAEAWERKQSGETGRPKFAGTEAAAARAAEPKGEDGTGENAYAGKRDEIKHRGGSTSTIAGTRLQTPEEKDQQRVDEWAKANPDRAAVLWQEAVEEAAAAGFTIGGKALLDSTTKVVYRKRIIAEYLTPKLTA